MTDQTDRPDLTPAMAGVQTHAENLRAIGRYLYATPANPYRATALQLLGDAIRSLEDACASIAQAADEIELALDAAFVADQDDADQDDARRYIAEVQANENRRAQAIVDEIAALRAHHRPLAL